MEFSFFVGLGFGGLGSFIALQALHKREVIKLKKYFSVQQDSYVDELHQQVNSLDQMVNEQQQRHDEALTTLKQQLQEQLQAQLKQEIAAREQLQQQLRQEQELNQIHQKKLRESNQDIDEILESLEQSQRDVISQKDQVIAELQARNNEQAISLEQLKVELFTLKQNPHLATQNEAANSNNNLGYWSPAQLEELLKYLFPDIVLLRDSLDVLASQPDNIIKLIKAIKDIYDGHPYSPTKVRATDKKWTECRVPQINLMRIYFQKCKKDSGYQVLISPKKNQKSQDQDYEWLKSHQTC
jgi:hypothetical protein